jgi:hypothetical protein
MLPGQSHRAMNPQFGGFIRSKRATAKRPTNDFFKLAAIVET